MKKDIYIVQRDNGHGLEPDCWNPNSSPIQTWEWGNYPEQWHISKNWWKSDIIIKNVKFYTAMFL